MKDVEVGGDDDDRRQTSVDVFEVRDFNDVACLMTVMVRTCKARRLMLAMGNDESGKEEGKFVKCDCQFGSLYSMCALHAGDDGVRQAHRTQEFT